MKILISIITLLATLPAFANFNNSFLDGSLGYPFDLSIENPDGTMAYYDGFAFKTAFHYNFSDNRSETAYGFSFHYKYLKLDNTKKSTVSETAIHKGVGVGIFAKVSGFYLGVNYSIMKATHQSSGNVSALDEFKYNPITAELSYTVPYGNMIEIGPGASYSFADLSKTETGLSKDSSYKEKIVWLKIIFFFK
ncbi:MAG: hypothetical protein V4596_04020 [Bdellovibrionota bacterium]